MVRAAWLAVMLLTVGCARVTEPEEVVRSFYELCEVARQDGPTTVQEPLAGLLSADSVQLLEQCASELNAKLPEAARVKGEQCLVFSALAGGSRDLQTTRVADGQKRVRMEVTSQGSSRLAELVREESGWKLDLAATIELNRTSSAAR